MTLELCQEAVDGRDGWQRAFLDAEEALNDCKEAGIDLGPGNYPDHIRFLRRWLEENR